MVPFCFAFSFFGRVPFKVNEQRKGAHFCFPHGRWAGLGFRGALKISVCLAIPQVQQDRGCGFGGGGRGQKCPGGMEGCRENAGGGVGVDFGLVLCGSYTLVVGGLPLLQHFNQVLGFN